MWCIGGRGPRAVTGGQVGRSAPRTGAALNVTTRWDATLLGLAHVHSAASIEPDSICMGPLIARKNVRPGLLFPSSPAAQRLVTNRESSALEKVRAISVGNRFPKS